MFIKMFLKINVFLNVHWDAVNTVFIRPVFALVFSLLPQEILFAVQIRRRHVEAHSIFFHFSVHKNGFYHIIIFYLRFLIW